jgi:aminoglycoside/choline kinase family phosphotransferase
VLKEAALMHAEFWGAGPEDERAWLLRGDIASNLLAQVTSDAMGAFRENFAEELDEHASALLDHYITHGAEIAQKLHESPLTLIHGDFRLDNMFFEADRSIRAFADWQGTGFSPGAWDVAYFLSGSLDEAPTEEELDELLELYYETLIAHGVSDYEFDAFRRDIDLSFVLLLGRISALEELDFGDDRGQVLIHGWVRRLVACVATVDVPSAA